MNKTHYYILNEVDLMKKECRKMRISPSEWVERYAKDYHRKYSNDSMQKGGMLKKEVS